MVDAVAVSATSQDEANTNGTDDAKDACVDWPRKRSRTAALASKRRWLSDAWRSSDAQSESRVDNRNFKSRMCWFVDKPDGCLKGDSCPFAHTSAELEEEEKEDKPEKAFFSGHQYDWDNEHCPFFARGCCFYSADKCWFKHEDVTGGETAWKTMLCKEFMETGSCSFTSGENSDTCKFAHGQEELRTPSIHKGMPGYKCILCTYYMLDETTCNEELCFDAHGSWDFRGVPLALPRHLSDSEASYCDSHIHLDQVLWTRRWGTNWFYKREPCRFEDCPNPRCLRAHAGEMRPRLEIDRDDFASLASELAGVGAFKGCVHSCCEPGSIEDALTYVRWGRELLDGKVLVAFGIHPASYESYTPEIESRMVAALKECGDQGVAWGECGLDYYRRHVDAQDPTLRAQMIDVFVRQIRVAVANGWPLVVHCRDADVDTLAVLQEHLPSGHPVCLHSFTGSLEFLSAFTSHWSRGYIGIAGYITYRSALKAYGIARAAPLDRILLETDGPYMAPEPYRGYCANPGHIPWIADAVARARNATTSDILQITFKNFCEFYKLRPAAA